MLAPTRPLRPWGLGAWPGDPLRERGLDSGVPDRQAGFFVRALHRPSALCGWSGEPCARAAGTGLCSAVWEGCRWP